VDVEILGVVYVVPVPKELPPDEAEYQLIVPAEAVAPSVTVPGPHLAPGVVAVMVGIAFTVIVTVFEVAGLPVTQIALDVITQVTVLPLVNVLLV
jgi:hypothetical protein